VDAVHLVLHVEEQVEAPSTLRKGQFSQSPGIVLRTGMVLHVARRLMCTAGYLERFAAGER
jgi:hypothetical protein